MDPRLTTEQRKVWTIVRELVQDGRDVEFVVGAVLDRLAEPETVEEIAYEAEAAFHHITTSGWSGR